MVAYCKPSWSHRSFCPIDHPELKYIKYAVIKEAHLHVRGAATGFFLDTWFKNDLASVKLVMRMEKSWWMK